MFDKREQQSPGKVTVEQTLILGGFGASWFW